MKEVTAGMHVSEEKARWVDEGAPLVIESIENVSKDFKLGVACGLSFFSTPDGGETYGKPLDAYILNAYCFYLDALLSDVVAEKLKTDDPLDRIKKLLNIIGAELGADDED